MALPVIAGHTGAVYDLNFSPMHDSCLASCSQDGSVKMWMIPEGGVTKTITEADSDMKGHQKKVLLVKWHPTADFTLCSSSADGTVKIWDI